MNKFSLFSFLPRPIWDEPNEGAGGATGTPPPADPPPADPVPGSSIPGDNTSPSGDDTAAGDDSGSDGEPEPPAPVTMEDITLPDGVEISESEQTALLEVLNNNDLSRGEMVSKLISMQVEASAAAQTSAWDEVQTQWRNETAALPNFGGDKLEQNLAEIKRGLDAAGATKEAYEALEVTGLGNNPHILPLLHKLAQPFLEGGPLTGKPSQGNVDRAAKLYPTMSKE